MTDSDHICSYEGCGRPAWRPAKRTFLGGGDWCVFHSPLRLRKREAFDDAWVKLVSTSAVDRGVIGSLDCTGFIFPINVNLENLVISGDAVFRNAVFMLNVGFGNIRFTRADFSGARFMGDLAIKSSTFAQDADFSAARFDGRTDFSGSGFTGSALFPGTLFAGHAGFRDTGFTRARFDHAGFERHADFVGATFREEANFSNVAFSGNARFTRATFDGRAIFDDARFSSYGYFSDINFSSAHVSFKGTGTAEPRTNYRSAPLSVASMHEMWLRVQKWRLKYKVSPT